MEGMISHSNPLPWDINRDGTPDAGNNVDGLDYILWSNNYDQGCPEVPGAVPEPGALSLLAVGLACLRRRPRG